jgi:hypothetical protein
VAPNAGAFGDRKHDSFIGWNFMQLPGARATFFNGTNTLAHPGIERSVVRAMSNATETKRIRGWFMKSWNAMLFYETSMSSRDSDNFESIWVM